MRASLPLRRFVDPARPITYGIVQAGEDHPNGVPYIRPADMNGHNGVPDPSLLRRTAPEIALTYKRSEVRPGDLVVSIGPSFGKVMIVPNELDGANLTQGTARLAPAPGVDPRFLYWSLQSKATVAHWESVVSGATFNALNLEPLGRTPIISLDHPSQRRVADFLDAETARIDVLIRKKRRMIELLNEQVEARVESELRATADRHGELPLKFLAQTVTVGIVVTPARWYSDEGVPALRGVNVTAGHISLHDLIHLTPEGDVLHPKSRLAQGDLVTVRSGEAGATAVVPAELEGANCVDLLITRPLKSVSPHYLEAVVNSDWCRKHIAKHSVGALQSHFNVEALKGLPIPALSEEEQDSLAERLYGLRRKVEQLAASLDIQIGLLLEHREALITAAITGEFPVAGAA